MSYIEELFKKYPDIRKEAIVKVEALRRGVKLDGETLDAFLSRAWVRKSGVFSYDWNESKQKPGRPEHFGLPGDSICQLRRNHNSPYSIKLIEGSDDKCLFYDNDCPIMEVNIPPAHELWNRKLSDGTPLPLIVEHVSGDGAGVIVLSACCWQKGEECAFCDNVNRSTEARKGKDPYYIEAKDPELVAEAYELLFKGGGIIHQNMTGGAIPHRYNGKADTDFYLQYLEATTKRVEFPDNYALATTAKSKEDLRRIRAAGMKKIAINLEVWEPRLFTLFCPGKNRIFGGRDAYIQSLVDAVDVFGAGNVITNFVVGVEMSQPHGFKDVDSALKSSLGGYEWLMQRKIVPRADYWCIEEKCRLGPNQTPPPSDFFMRLTIGTYELLQKYGLPPSPFFCRKCSVIDPIHDLY